MRTCGHKRDRERDRCRRMVVPSAGLKELRLELDGKAQMSAVSGFFPFWTLSFVSFLCSALAVLRATPKAALLE